MQPLEASLDPIRRGRARNFAPHSADERDCGVMTSPRRSVARVVFVTLVGITTRGPSPRVQAISYLTGCRTAQLSTVAFVPPTWTSTRYRLLTVRPKPLLSRL